MTSHPLSPDEPVRLPTALAPLPPPSFPLMSAVVPIVGAVVLWIVTASPYVLWFAALGPLLALASMLDGRRGTRRARRHGTRELRERHVHVREQIAAHHERERRLLWSRHPDVVTHLSRPEETWRAVAHRDESLVVGVGTVRSALRLEGGDDGEDAGRLRSAARALEGAPVLVPLRAGVAVIGPLALAEAVARALVLQICLNLPPGRLRVAGDAREWMRALPHSRATSGEVLSLVGAGATLPVDVDIPIAVVEADSPPPPRCGAVLTLVAPGRARLDHGDVSQEVRLEALSYEQAGELVEMLAARAAMTHGTVEHVAPPLRELLRDAPHDASGSLPVPIGVAGGAPAEIDLVAEGPHAVVIGVTGSGKSELLTTWVTALAARYAPSEVSFLLVDFKGGRAFDPLTVLPHVTGVLTDLDDVAALRAIESLRAELRHRERVLAEAGARDIAESGDALSRLVIVVDEYAALVATHPALHELFGDVAARGRALGMHLVLASQRAAGVFRDAVLANAPLRLALRVTDAADSRAVIGVDDAAVLSGRADDRGVCLIRGAADASPRLVRVSRCAPEEIALLGAPGAPARPPWLPPLAGRIDLAAAAVPGAVVVGIADEPESQRQRPLLLDEDGPGLVVLGASGSGRSAALRALAQQGREVVWVSADPEPGWDGVEAAERARPGALVVCDDLDLLLGRLPHDHAAVLRERIERLAREARARGIRLIVSAQRPTGAVARIAEAIPRRLLLAHASRADHVAAGGAAAEFSAALPPGRGRLDGVLIQTPWTPEPGRLGEVRSSQERAWHPSRHPVAYVAPAGPVARAVLGAWATHGSEIVSVDDPGASLRRGTVVWGTPESWLAQWRLLSAARAEAQLIVDVACAGEHRSITGSRELPPYAHPHAPRAWRVRPDGTVTRIVLPGSR